MQGSADPRAQAAGPAPRHVVFVASECEPWAKTGGLADVVDALARALGRIGIAVDVFLPAYRTARRPPIRDRITVAVPVSRSADEDPSNDAEREADRAGVATVDILSGPANGYRLRLVDHPFHFDRAGFYGDEGGDYPDNGARFALFCRAALEAVRAEGRPIDVIHGHDWQAALALIYRDVHYAQDPLIGRAATVLTIHNLAYHGWVPRDRVAELQLPERIGEAAGVDLLREGIRAADLVTTVSPTYAREALTPAYGMGLEDDLAARDGRARRFLGIMNGIDPGLWDPATDASLSLRYGRRADRARGVAPLAEGKRAAKADLATRHGLAEADSRPLLGMIGRLDPQKGFDLVAGAAEGMVRAGANLIVLGTGRAELLAGLRSVAAANPGRIAVIERFDRDEARRIYAGSDLFLMPSRFEPSGQGQLIAFRYGTPVIARRTGGLADTVVDDDDARQGGGAGTGLGNGFLFEDPTPAALLQAVRRALFAYADRPRWQALCRRVIALDHSWDRPAREYVAAYRRAIGFRPKTPGEPPRGLARARARGGP
jgi:starch synthase